MCLHRSGVEWSSVIHNLGISGVITRGGAKPTSSELGRLASTGEVGFVDGWYKATRLTVLKQPQFGPQSLPDFLRHD
jgi:hypothetical protein